MKLALIAALATAVSGCTATALTPQEIADSLEAKARCEAHGGYASMHRSREKFVECVTREQMAQSERLAVACMQGGNLPSFRTVDSSDRIYLFTGCNTSATPSASATFSDNMDKMYRDLAESRAEATRNITETNQQTIRAIGDVMNNAPKTTNCNPNGMGGYTCR